MRPDLQSVISEAGMTKFDRFTPQLLFIPLGTYFIYILISSDYALQISIVRFSLNSGLWTPFSFVS